MEDVQAYDFETLLSFTTTETGDRIILTFETDQGPINISLPESDVQNVIVSVVLAAGKAKSVQEQKPTPNYLEAESFRYRRHKTRDESYFVVDLPGGSELLFRSNRQTARRFAEGLAQEFGLIPPERPESAGGKLQ